LEPLKRFLFGALGAYDWLRFAVVNRLRIDGREHLAGLPSMGVLFVSNHLTYYMDVLAIHHALAGSRCRPWDGFRANLNVRFVAAVETLNDRGLIPRVFKYTGAVPIRRTWKDGGDHVKRAVDPADLQRIGSALRRGWLITFPQGTTTAGAPVRKGTAHIIREHMPIVVPVRLDGFDLAFSRKGFRGIASGIDLGVRFGAPLSFRADDTIERIVDVLTSAVAPVTAPPAADPL
jgi:1-acyl-sn-glycerol-3-phosphate acyltransferase